MGLAVVTVAAGGLPIVESTVGGTPVTEATNGRGLPVTKVVGKPGLPVVFETIGIGGGGGGGAEAAAFLARTSGLDATHSAAYAALIDGLVADGIWAKLDVLYIFATQNNTTALLNLVSTSYTGDATGHAPTFTADRGYSQNGTSYVNSTFTPTTAPSPKYTQNSAHVSSWSLTNSPQNTLLFGADNGVTFTGAHAGHSLGTSAYFYCNNGASGGGPIVVANTVGHYQTNRSSSSNLEGYKNGVQLISEANASSGNLSKTIFFAGFLDNATPNSLPLQVTMGSIGASLTSTQATNFYNRLRTYMTAVGVP